MDFASALANFEKTANASTNSSSRSPPQQQQRQQQQNNYNNQRYGGGDHDHDRRRGRSADNDYHDNRRNQRPRHHYHHDGNNSNRGGGGGGGGGGPFDAMYRFGYRVARYRGPSRVPPDLHERPFHIALLAITIDDMPYEHLWKAWATTLGEIGGGNGNVCVSLLCHAKHPGRVSSAWLRQRLIVRKPRLGRGNSYADPEYLTHKPEWGSVQITRAMIDLLAAAMRIGPSDRESDMRFSGKRHWIPAKPNEEVPAAIPPVDKCIFISETCVPVKTLEECEREIFPSKDGKDGTKTSGGSSSSSSSGSPSLWEISWVNARNRNTPGTPKNKYERDQFSGINNMVPQHCRWKADQWVMLSRPHVAAIMDIDRRMRHADQLWNSFSDISASDEMYVPTALAILGILTEDRDDERGGGGGGSKLVAKRPVTYTDWSEGMRNPASFTKGMSDFSRLARLARKQGCLFARKFAPFQNIPGKEPVITGEISTEEWMAEVRALAEEDKARRAVVAQEEEGKDDGKDEGETQNQASQEDAEEEANGNSGEDLRGAEEGSRDGDGSSAPEEKKTPAEEVSQDAAEESSSGSKPAEEESESAEEEFNDNAV